MLHVFIEPFASLALAVVLFYLLGIVVLWGLLLMVIALLLGVCFSLLRKGRGRLADARLASLY